MLDRYRAVVWTRNGMTYPHLNCWGLVRLARHEVLGLPLLRAFGTDATDKREVTRNLAELCTGSITEIPGPAEGAIATTWRGRLCLHVALVLTVNGRQGVLECDEHTGPRWLPLRKWLREHSEVRYYHDRHSPHIPFATGD